MFPLPATSSWIQVNLNQPRKVTGIVIQGCPQNDHWITKFKLQHSMDGATWTNYAADGAVSEPFKAWLLGRRTTLSPETSSLSSFFQGPQTETHPTLSCWVRPCRRSTSASSRWSSTVRQAFASTSWAARQTVRKPLYQFSVHHVQTLRCYVPSQIMLWFNRCNHMRQ